ncbi:hypothetical protein LRE75_36415 [Streptomyces sp. 372A]
MAVLLIAGQKSAGDEGCGARGIVGDNDAVRLVDPVEMVWLDGGVVGIEWGDDELVRMARPVGR